MTPHRPATASVLAEALRLLQARETLRENIGKGFAQLDAGQGIAAEDVYARAEQRIGVRCVAGDADLRTGRPTSR